MMDHSKLGYVFFRREDSGNFDYYPIKRGKYSLKIGRPLPALYGESKETVVIAILDGNRDLSKCCFLASWLDDATGDMHFSNTLSDFARFFYEKGADLIKQS